jgi:hypothetical protein
VSGLQRSTVSSIVEQLIEERWVLYGATGRLPDSPVAQLRRGDAPQRVTELFPVTGGDGM